jgi:hypothetical protein
MKKKTVSSATTSTRATSQTSTDENAGLRTRCTQSRPLLQRLQRIDHTLRTYVPIPVNKHNTTINKTDIQRMKRTYQRIHNAGWFVSTDAIRIETIQRITSRYTTNATNDPLNSPKKQHKKLWMRFSQNASIENKPIQD